MYFASRGKRVPPREDQARVRELLGDRIGDGWMPLPTIVLAGEKRA